MSNKFSAVELRLEHCIEYESDSGIECATEEEALAHWNDPNSKYKLIQYEQMQLSMKNQTQALSKIT